MTTSSARTGTGRPAAALQLGLLLIALSPLLALAQTRSTPVNYTELTPLLARHCVVCHAGEGAPLALRLDSYAALLRGSSNGPVVVAGDPAGSELVRRLRGTSLPRMPLTGPPFLAEDEIALVERWIAQGLQQGPAALRPTTAAAPEAPALLTYRQVEPIFLARCVKCHMDGGLRGPAPEGLRLNSWAGALDSRERAWVVPGRPEASELLRRVRGQARPRMPLDGPPFLSADEIRLIEQWIAAGAPDAAGTPAPIPSGARVRLRGTLSPDGRLDGLELVPGNDLRRDRKVAPGDQVEVRGRLDATGRVIVERLKRD